MLETKNLKKIYKPKKGVPVVALDNVSIKFPEKGMVFLLGKSGSGKSTLLHLLGGLDKYDDGEVIIKGVSSKSFRQKHFDSYRNTYVGFIFQDYNVLDEFTVGANIALAIELQGRRAKDDEINRILCEVDLEGYGARKPNELSGGQKQRVAIARALVKNPQIIMADEPTGALDSATGKQVFDTLKKLSRDKLVIIVSHDREFAEQYADRIIELADGRVISDVELLENETPNDRLAFNGNTINIQEGYHLTEEDLAAINQYIDKIKQGKVNLTVKSQTEFNKRTRQTDETKIKYTDTSEFKPIKSKLPLKSAFKIGASGLKHKKFRLVITILLSCIAFGLFGLSDTFAAYNHVKTCTNSIIDTGIDYASLKKAKKVEYSDGYYYDDWGYTLNQEELDDISKNTGVKMSGVYLPFGAELSFTSNYNQEFEFTETDYHIYCYGFNGFTKINQEILEEMSFTLLCGTLPDGNKNEIGISSYAAETFIKSGYTDGTTFKDAKGQTQYKYQTVTDAAAMIGKVLTLNGEKYTVSCVIDTGFDLSRYKPLTVKKENETTADQLLDYALSSELRYIRNYSYIQVAFVGDGFVEKLVAGDPTVKSINGHLGFEREQNNEYLSINPTYLGVVEDVSFDCITWLNKGKTTLNEKEIIVSSDMLPNAYDPSAYFDPENPNKAIPEKYVFPEKMGTFTKYAFINNNDKAAHNEGEEYTVVGYIDTYKYPKLSSTVLAPQADCAELTIQDNGPYLYCVGNMPTEREEIESLVSYCYREDSDIRYELMNSVTYELDTVNEALQEMARVFLYIGLGFALFAAIMLANFIGTSISYKKQEIGILRAIGSRSNDVFRIFFSESFIIAMINFCLSAIGVFVATELINYILRREIGILITVLNFGFRQILLLLIISLLIAALSSFIPVKRIASKRPIDAIRDR